MMRAAAHVLEAAFALAHAADDIVSPAAGISGMAFEEALVANRRNRALDAEADNVLNYRGLWQ